MERGRQLIPVPGRHLCSWVLHAQFHGRGRQAWLLRKYPGVCLVWRGVPCFPRACILGHLMLRHVRVLSGMSARFLVLSPAR